MKHFQHIFPQKKTGYSNILYIKILSRCFSGKLHEYKHNFTIQSEVKVKIDNK